MRHRNEASASSGRTTRSLSHAGSIEYGAQGTYVIITSREGELHLVPDSAEWFEWLATISSFRFVGQQGRFTAYRDTRSEPNALLESISHHPPA